MAIIGHHLVNADCSRLSPINPVNQSQLMLTVMASAIDSNIIMPAIIRRASLIVITGISYSGLKALY
jgi:hypothetical protein